jgi:hypothetical protein
MPVVETVEGQGHADGSANAYDCKYELHPFKADTVVHAYLETTFGRS